MELGVDVELIRSMKELVMYRGEKYIEGSRFPSQKLRMESERKRKDE